MASTASSSNAVRVPRASWSNASKAWDDFKDGFDKINDVDTVVSDDISVSASGPDENYGKSWWLMAWFTNNTGVNLVCISGVDTCSSGMGYSSSACSCASGSWEEAVI